MNEQNQDVRRTADDVKQVILERGWLGQDEILEIWGLDADDYGRVQDVLNQDGEVSPGRRGIGGFRAKTAKGQRLPREDENAAALFDSEWESGAVLRLVELLNHRELEGLLGDLVYTVRRARRLTSGENRRGTKSELASALLIQHGNDLFCDKAARALIAGKCGVSFPRRWAPGKTTAIRFVQATQFPLVFAGVPADGRRPDYEFLEGHVDLAPLAEFQREVGRKMLSKLHLPSSRAILTLPTGAGKTRVAVDSLRDWLVEHWRSHSSGFGNTILWLAHTEELCEQAYMCFRDVWRASANVSPLWLIRFWGGYTQDLIKHQKVLINLRLHPAVLISTPQRIVNLYQKKINGAGDVVELLQETVGAVIIDEAHRAAAPTYRTILDHAKKSSDPVVIGLTATPFRGEYARENPQAGALELKTLFKEIIEPIQTLGTQPHLELQNQGFLARPTWQTIRTKTIQKFTGDFDLENLDLEDIDRIDHALKVRADNADRRMSILEHILPICRRKEVQVIYFGPSVLDAECMAFMLRQRAVPAAFISGETRDVTRRRIVNDFRQGRTRVLCNCEVLTTGFDAPRVTHVVMARPTVSQVMYEQMLGRGLRGPRFGGTEECIVIDCEDDYRGGRPVLGYEAFRGVWKAGSSSNLSDELLIV